MASGVGRHRQLGNLGEHEVNEQVVPAAVIRAIDAVNAGDTDAFLSEFAADGWIDDNGHASADTARCGLRATAS